jgi:Fe-S cluster assembly protein SufD
LDNTPAAPNVTLPSAGQRFTSRDVAAFEVPSPRDEDWRMTPLRRLRGLHDGTANTGGREPYESVATGPRDGVTAEVTGRDDPRLGQVVRPADRVAALAWNGFTHAAIVSVADGAQVADPYTLTVTGPGEGAASYGHILIQAGRQSESAIVIDYRGAGTHADNVEIVIGPGSHLKLVFRHEWDDGAVHLTAHHCAPGRDSVLRHASVTLRGGLVRSCPAVTFTEAGADAELTAVVFADAGQHFEHRPIVDHQAPHCRSRITFRGAAQGSGARTVWIGDQVIRAGADGTDSYQNGRTILLTSDARADSVPRMEIETGAVAQAGHASTTGRLDEGQMYYLMARGIPEAEARRLIVLGFFTAALDGIGMPDLQDEVKEAIGQSLTRSSPQG